LIGDNLKYLITGGAGFIGTSLTALLLKEGHCVNVIDDLSTGTYKNVEFLRDQSDKYNTEFKFFRGDCGQMDLSLAAGSGCDAIIHLASFVGVFRIIDEATRVIRENIEHTAKMIEVAKFLDVPVYLASTSEAYGKEFTSPFVEGDNALVGSPANLRWAYTYAKLAEESLMYSAKASDPSFRFVIFRLFNTVGPRQLSNYGMVLPRFVEQYLSGRSLEVFGTGKQSRCFCDVRDVVRAIRAILDCDEAFGETFNIGSTEVVSVERLADLVIDIGMQITSELASGTRQSKVYIPYEKAYKAGFDDMMQRVPDTSKIQRLTGWQPTLSLEDTIKSVFEYTLRG
jgi:UDP-glucose 4-epimerase